MSDSKECLRKVVTDRIEPWLCEEESLWGVCVLRVSHSCVLRSIAVATSTSVDCALLLAQPWLRQQCLQLTLVLFVSLESDVLN